MWLVLPYQKTRWLILSIYEPAGVLWAYYASDLYGNLEFADTFKHVQLCHGPYNPLRLVQSDIRRQHDSTTAWSIHELLAQFQKPWS